MGDTDRIRIVTLGSRAVGKTQIVKRFLFNTFNEKYKPTVEDLYNKEYDFGHISLKVDILDTSGSQEFPATRRISIATAHAFLLVYALDSRESFDCIKNTMDEIREQRADFQEIPFIIAGNKMDIGYNRVEIEFDEVSDYISDCLPPIRAKIMECSAKENKNVKELFKGFIHLSRIPFEESNEETSGLKRRSSAHAGSKCTKTLSVKPPAIPSSPQRSQPGSGRSSGCNTPSSRGPASPSALAVTQFLTTDDHVFNRNKPRSRSLIRRCSKKVKKQVQDASGECQIT